MTQPNNAGRQAREQAKAYDSPFAPTPLKLDDGSVIEVPPFPQLRMLDDDAQAEFERLQFDLESYDRHPDRHIPEQKAKDRNGDEITLPAETVPGQLKEPFRKTDPDTGEVTLLDPPYHVRVARIALGETDYARLRAGTINGRRGSQADVWRVWNEQGVEIAKRAAEDSKSNGSPNYLAAVPAADGQRPVPVPSPADS